MEIVVESFEVGVTDNDGEPSDLVDSACSFLPVAGNENVEREEARCSLVLPTLVTARARRGPPPKVVGKGGRLEFVSTQPRSPD